MEKFLKKQKSEATKLNIYYKRYILDEYCNSRRNAIVKLFIDALTKGGPNGQSPRPIELNSHDPVRYMGDMLAWIHQATASENEFLRSLFRKFKENTGKNNNDFFLNYMNILNI